MVRFAHNSAFAWFFENTLKKYMSLTDRGSINYILGGYSRWGLDRGFNGDLPYQVINEYLATAENMGLEPERVMTEAFFTRHGRDKVIIPRNPHEVLSSFLEMVEGR